MLRAVEWMLRAVERMLRAVEWMLRAVEWMLRAVEWMRKTSYLLTYYTPDNSPRTPATGRENRTPVVKPNGSLSPRRAGCVKSNGARCVRRNCYAVQLPLPYGVVGITAS
eukprot:9331305-Pyramimonas_sp.AAC.1